MMPVNAIRAATRMWPSRGSRWLLLFVASASAWASGPRFVTGQPFFPGPQGVAIGWKQPTLLYYTDPADLSANVAHAQADALVSAAASVWNVPVASVTVAQGGGLAEHSDSSNVYLDVNGMVFPADVQSTNYAAVPIAVLYDTNGSVTDTLLGQGASDPSNCTQAAVTESVDRFDPAGFILHAIIVLNGRCTGPAPAQQLELQYQLERVFGRVLGLAWSQANDNVFTGTPVPSYVQEEHWPILHPIDIVCGPYAYQCLPQPFQLRDDDISALVSVYPIARTATLQAGKQPSLSNAMQAGGRILFPNGQGMAGVNVLVQRQIPNSQLRDAWIEGSSVTGFSFRRAGVSPFVAAGTDAAGSMGTSDLSQQGNYFIPYIPLVRSTYTGQDLVITTEPVNPLYSGPYSLGPYSPGAVSPAGSGPTPTPSTILYPYTNLNSILTVPDAPQSCGTGTDGTLAAPMQAPVSGWWTGQICGYGHASYVGMNVKPGRSFTFEVTALDALGLATTAKLMPVLAFYDPSDTSTQPSQGLAASAFQAIGLGTTALSGQTGQLTRLRLGIADQRGEGRPDFNYQARLFYADSVLPAQLGQAGGNVTITGTGFRNGNSVQINGVDANVMSWTATAIVVTLPSMANANAAASDPLDITVTDLGTGAISTMTGAFKYDSASALPNVMKLLTAQAGNGFVGQATSVPFSVQVLKADGVTPVAGDSVTLSTAAGNVIFGVCGSTSCTVLTDASGVVSSASTPSAVGSVTLQASDGALLQTASFTALAQAGSILVTSSLTSVPVATTATFSVRVLAPNGSAMSGRIVQLSAVTGSVTFGGCFAATCGIVTDSKGNASIQVTPTSSGTIVLQASDGSVTVQSTLQAPDNSDILRISVAPAAMVPLGQTGAIQVQLLRHDGVTPDGYQTITFSGSNGVNLVSCGTVQVCPMTTDHNGLTGVLANPTALGTYTLTASYGALTQTGSFQVVTPAPVQIHILSFPTGSVVVGQVAPQPFTVQLLQADGKTPITNVRLTLSGPQDAVRLGICGSGSCLVNVDSKGMVSTSVTPLLPGQITLNAVYLPAIETATFTALGPPASLQFTTQPGPGGGLVGTASPLTVTAVAIGGTSPGVGYVQMAINQGSAVISPCAAPCGPKLDLNGVIKFTVKPIAPGPITVTATWGAITLTQTFYAYAQGDVMRLISGPAGTALTQVAATPPFSVQVLGNDGVTPAPGKAVTFSTSIGSVRFAACGASTCTVTSDANGLASSAVTPLVPGVTTLTAYDGAANQADTFTAQNPPDLLSLVSSPISGSFVGSAASTLFSARALLADGMSAAAGASVTVSVTYGSAALGACAGASRCTVVADANGVISTSVTPSAPGSIALLVDDRGVQVTANFVAVTKPGQMFLLSAPSGTVALGTAAAPALAIRMVDGYGNPLAGQAVLFSSAAGTIAWSACPLPACTVLSAADGTATITASPLVAGAVSLMASFAALAQSASFTSVVPPDSLALISVPADGSLIGSAALAPLAVQVLGGYPTLPQSGKNVTMTVTSGNALLSACGQSTCSLVSDAGGVATSGVQPSAAGPVTLLVQEGAASLTETFNALAVPDLLRDVSMLSPQIHAGDLVVLKVQAFAPDGLNPDAGRILQFTLTGGSAALAGCAGNACSAATDTQGVASLEVTPGAVGALTFLVAEAGVANSRQLPLVLTVLPALPVNIVALEPATFVAEQAAVTFYPSVEVLESGAPLPSVPLLWTGANGFSADSGGSSTDTAGLASVRATAGPLLGGSSATLSACVTQILCASFTATGVAPALFQLAIESGAGQVVTGGAAYTDVIARVTDGSAHAVAGAGVTVYQTVTVGQPCPTSGRCPAAPILASRVTVVRSGLDGTVDITPLSVSEVAITQTQIAVSTGSSGYATTILSAQ